MNELSRVWDAPGQLPVNYEAAKVALAECAEIDQCKDWSDKAQALASYARQADDPTIYNFAMRIKARAVRRAGELLKQIDARPANAAKQSGGAPTLISQREAAEAAGLSKDQQVTAVRVANIPELEFETQVESDAPPTITALAEQGRKPTPKIETETPVKLKGFAEAGRFIGEISDFDEFIAGHPPDAIRAGMYEPEAQKTLPKVRRIADWLGRYLKIEEVR